jgi:hypothetical protein
MSMRAMCAALLLLAVPGTGAAQQPRRWVVTGSVAQSWFGKTATGEATDFGPSPGLAVSLGVARHLGAWEVSLAADSRPSVLRASDSVSDLQLSSLSFGRTGLALTLGRQLARTASASVFAGAGLRLDGWTLPEDVLHWRAGTEAHLALRFGSGSVSLEDRVTIGISASPFDTADLPEGYERSALRWMSVEIGLRVGL